VQIQNPKSYIGAGNQIKKWCSGCNFET